MYIQTQKIKGNTAEIKHWNSQIENYTNQNIQYESTQVWTCPPGIYLSLQKADFSFVYTFKQGIDWFPTDYKGHNDPRNYLYRETIDTGIILNPPYNETQLVPILEHTLYLIKVITKVTFL